MGDGVGGLYFYDNSDIRMFYLFLIRTLCRPPAPSFIFSSGASGRYKILHYRATRRSGLCGGLPLSAAAFGGRCLGQLPLRAAAHPSCGSFAPP